MVAYLKRVTRLELGSELYTLTTNQMKRIKEHKLIILLVIVLLASCMLEGSK